MADQTVLRIIDANLNRAREALRVMEEYARFGLDDAGLTATIKETRHVLGEAVSAFEASARAEARGSERGGSVAGRPALIRARDIVGDVGCEVNTPEEYERSDSMHVALAAGKRLSEALRAVEEYGKTFDPGFAVSVEKIRYRGYELERRLALTASARERFGHVRLYVIITEALCREDWLATAEAALRGGADCLQLREKDLPDRVVLDRARQLARLCHDHDAMLIVNDRPDIVALSGADGVHLGQDDLPITTARRILPSTGIVGVSTHNMVQVRTAAAGVPDYIAVGPMYATATKPQDHIAGPQVLGEARTQTSLPLVAIGGINEKNASEVLAVTSCCLCVCTGVVARADVAAAASGLRALIESPATGRAPSPRDTPGG
jgi:thiamine-phosphate pyrophosphorylase